MTADERAERDRDEREAWIREQLSTAPDLSEAVIARLRHRRVLHDRQSA